MKRKSLKQTHEDNSNLIKVLFSAAEADPFIKVGGLADVAYALPQALRSLPPDLIDNRKIDVRLFLPFHSAIRETDYEAHYLFDFEVPFPHGSIPAQAYYSEINHMPVYLIAGNPIPHGAPVYSSDNYMDGMKYIFFSLACLSLVEKLRWKIDILHANDWHTAIEVYVLSFLRKQSSFFSHTKSILTIHNLPYMGGGTDVALQDSGIPPSQDPELPIWGRSQPLPMGMSTADRFTAVSPGYAEEILTPEFGCGLEKFLLSRANRLSGIINGLDLDLWDPGMDNNIPARFDDQHIENRKINKKKLLDESSLDQDLNTPLFIMIGRMDPQKGVDITLDALKKILDLKWTCILLGKGNPGIENEVSRMEALYPNRIRALKRFDVRLSRLMYAGADFILMPSRYEPCGLAQMIAMHYGCIPIARATGGLRDTIYDIHQSQNPTGFLFNNPDANDLAEKIKLAISYYSQPDIFKQIQINGMNMDFSWNLSAKKYADLYLDLMRMDI